MAKQFSTGRSFERKFKRKHKLKYFLADFRIIVLVDKPFVTKKNLVKKSATPALRELLAKEFENQAAKIRTAEDMNKLGFVIDKDESEIFKAAKAKVEGEAKQ